MRTRFTLAAILGLAVLACEGHALARDAVAPGTESGFALFQKKCTACHGNPAVDRAPSIETIRAMPPEKIYGALGANGVMTAQGAALTDDERRHIAEFMSGRPLGSASLGAAGVMPNQCGANPALPRPDSVPQWNGWS